MSVHTFYMYDDIQFGNLIIFYLQFDILSSHYARASLRLFVYLIRRTIHIVQDVLSIGIRWFVKRNIFKPFTNGDCSVLLY
jgi:hypothetical protein